MKKDEAISKLETLISRLDSLPPYQYSGNNSDFNKWYRDTEVAIERIFGDKTRHIKDFSTIHFGLMIISSSTPSSAFVQKHNEGRREAKTVLMSFIDEIKEYWTEADDEDSSIISVDYKRTVVTILLNFHRAVRQLLIRHSNRQTLEITDEYDVQDLLHSFLKLHFDDVRSEEYAPTYAGGASRIDFLINDQKIAIEVKKTRSNLKDKEVGEELMIDIMRYQAHPKVKSLICFIYDPEGYIRNPAGLESDLTQTQNGIEILVMVCPKF